MRHVVTAAGVILAATAAHDLWGADPGGAATAAARREMDDRWEASRRRADVTAGLAAALVDGRATPAGAVGRVAGMGRADPGWFAGVRASFQDCGLVRPGASDREVAARYLLVHLEVVEETAAHRGDVARAGAAATCLAALSAEAGPTAR
ncbi:MAG: hypothetical protein C0501_10465 [Isosphaera sp.]|nr:hypothetical protein [Isosphaera sp.]